MKFALVYSGPLSSNANPAKKWDIRNRIAPQMQRLWEISPTLQIVKRQSIIPDGQGYMQTEWHHTQDPHGLKQEVWRAGSPAMAPEGKIVFGEKPEKSINLCQPIEVGGRSFIPLVRDSLALKCSLKIAYFKRDEPGKIIQSGDLDNRLKTLFDALSVPDDQQIINDGSSDPIFCLMENDRQITGVTIESHQLLAPMSNDDKDVHMTIEVDVRVTQSRRYNQAFLGD
jgi:hypothetical protein